MNKDVLFSSKTDLWETPQDFFDMLDAEFGFTLDAAADAQNHKCPCYYTREQDGLKQPWPGTVWCNPPYGRQIGKWVQKASYENYVNNNTIVMLLPARTDTRWFHTYIYERPNVETRFVRGRLKFGWTPVCQVAERNDPRKASENRLRKDWLCRSMGGDFRQ